MIDYAEDEGGNFPAVTRTARKPHRCDECGRTIEPGEQYKIGAGIYDRSAWHAKQCRHCVAATTWLQAECGGFLHNAVREDLEEHWSEVLPRSLWLGRAIVGMRRRWRRRDGTLLAVLEPWNPVPPELRPST